MKAEKQADLQHSKNASSAFAKAWHHHSLNNSFISLAGPDSCYSLLTGSPPRMRTCDSSKHWCIGLSVISERDTFASRLIWQSVASSTLISKTRSL